MKDKTKQRAMSATKSMAYVALLAAIICVMSPFAVNVGPIPLSLGSLAVYIAAATIDKWHGTAAVLVFVLLGSFGVPVFTGFTGGFYKLIGPTGGFIFGYLPCAFIIGLIVDFADRKPWIYPIAMIAGTVVLYACGAGWYMLTASASLVTALSLCVVPFLVGDSIKIVAASILCYSLRQVLKRVLNLQRGKKQNNNESVAAATADNNENDVKCAADKEKQV